MECKKCGSTHLLIRKNAKNPSATDLYCGDCGAWQKFATKDEVRLFSKQTHLTLEDRLNELDRQLLEFEKCLNELKMLSKRCAELLEKNKGAAHDV